MDGTTGQALLEEASGRTILRFPDRLERQSLFLQHGGITTVVRCSKTFQSLAKNDVAEQSHASFAFSEGNLFLRTRNHLFCIGHGRTN